MSEPTKSGEIFLSLLSALNEIYNVLSDVAPTQTGNLENIGEALCDAQNLIMRLNKSEEFPHRFDTLFSIDEVAKITKECKTTWYRRIKRGFPHKKVGASFKIRKSDLDHFVESQAFGSFDKFQSENELFCRKWNFEADGVDQVRVCKELHEKGQPCDYELMDAQEIVDLIEKLRSELLGKS